MPDHSARILSPNLGCPALISAAEPEFDIIIAASDAEGFSVRAKPSYEGEGTPSDVILSPAVELCDGSLPPAIQGVEETRRILPSRVLRGIFGDAVRYWAFRARLAIKPATQLQRSVRGQPRPTLFDLELNYNGRDLGSVRHALCIRTDSQQVKFVHLTDLHIAARNDIWASQMNRSVVPDALGQGPLHFTNFNDRFRKFAEWANAAADEGKLDLILALGDLIDFVYYGYAATQAPENNWQAFIELVTGPAGLRVPIFTTLGNHDWRTFPYPPGFAPAIFGLDKANAAKLDPLYYNSSEECGKKIEDVYKRLTNEGSPILARAWWRTVTLGGLQWLSLITERVNQRLQAWMRSYFWRIVTPIVTTGAIWRATVNKRYTLMGVLAAFVLLAFTAVRAWITSRLRGTISYLIGIEAGPEGLRDYLLHVNPYFNLALQVGRCYFILMDTGHDCLIAQSFWDDGGKKLGPISVKHDMVGGAPDTMAFYPPNELYPYGQIEWLETVLSCIRRNHGIASGSRECRIIVGVHTPPANLSAKDRIKADRQRGGSTEPLLMDKSTYDIRYGTINHFLSQFYYLCLGYREVDLEQPSGPAVDMVLAGHTHWNLEFRLRKPDGAGATWDPELYYGEFSSAVEDDKAPAGFWGPLLLQTAACGPPSVTAPKTPNYRYITVDADLGIRHLRPEHLG